MARYKKDVLYPGTYRLEDGRTVTYSPAEVRRLANRVNEMTGQGLHIPACWAHQEDAKPGSADEAASRARHNLGFVTGAEITPEGYAVVTLEVPGQDDASRLPAVRFVSPELSHDWTDGDGRTWAGRSITHIAVTPRPVQHRQKPFEKLSFDTPRREWLSLGDYMADDKEKPDKKEGGGGGSDEGGGGNLKGLIEALRGAGLNIPDEVSSIDDIIIAVKASGGEAPEAPAPAETEGLAEASSPMLMALQGRLLKTERLNLERRVGDLFRQGKIGASVKSKLLSGLKTERLSLDRRTAELTPSKLLYQIEAYEELDAGLAGARQERLGHEAGGAIREVDPPEGADEKEMREMARQRAGAMSRTVTGTNGKGGDS